MDATQTFNDMVTSFISQEWEETMDHAFDLMGWLRKDGFFSLNKNDTMGFCRIVIRVCKNHIARSQLQ